MRVGVLVFASVSEMAEAALETLRTRDIDVVTADSIVVTLDDAIREAKRLSRADCDGVLLLVGEGMHLETVSAAALLLAGVPLLLACDCRSPAYFESVGAMETIGSRFDRVCFINGEPDLAPFLEVWLRENARKQRHRGLEAARKLYGQRLYIPRETGDSPDAALWIHQFGVIVTAETEGADFAAPGGDACGALSGHLLALVSDETTISRVPIVASPGSNPEEGDADVTFARISRIRGRFRCLLLRGALRTNGASVARFDCSNEALFAAALSPWLHAVPGDHFGAMRAACDSLDIETVLLR